MGRLSSKTLKQESTALLVCGTHTFDYVFACEAFGRDFLMLLALVQIAEIVNACGIGGGSNGSGGLRRLMLQRFLWQ